MRRSFPVVLATAAAMLPFSSALAAQHSTAHKTTSVPTHTYQGAGVDMQWGTVQVTIVVKGKKVIDIRTTAPNERARSAYINNIAVPWLRSAALKAQSANIDLISGATMTSEAFASSLQDALKRAHL